MKKIVVFIILIIISCSNKEPQENSPNIFNREMDIYESKDFDINNIENNFPDKTYNSNEDLTKIDKLVLIPYEIMSNIFLYPVNETIYEKSYLRSKYYVGYKIKLSNNIWILCYLHHFDLHSEEVIWTIYNSENKQIKSNLVIASWNENTEKRVSSFDGKKISITTLYQRNFQNGMEGNNTNPIKTLENFEIDKNYRFIRIK